MTSDQFEKFVILYGALFVFVLMTSGILCLIKFTTLFLFK